MGNLELDYEQIRERVSLWIVDLKKYHDDKHFRYFCSLLNQEEYNEIHRITTYKKQMERIIQRGILKEILGKDVALQPAKILIGKTEKGKPFLVNRNIPFNYSHSENYFMIALSKNGQIGVDIQIPKKLKYSYPQMIFSPREKKVYEEIKEEVRRREFFYQVWTSKEAFVKATGDGITVNLNEIELFRNGELIQESSMIYNKINYNVYVESAQNERYFFTYVHMENTKEM